MPVYNSWSREIPRIRGGGQPIPAGLSYPPPKILDPHLSTSIETDLKCFNSYYYELTTESICLMPVYNSWSQEIPRIRGGGQPIPAGLSYPPPKILDPHLSTSIETALKCFNSYYYELTTESTCFMPVYNNLSQEIPRIRGGGQPIPAGLSYPPPKILDPHLSTSIETALKCFNSYYDELNYWIHLSHACLQQLISRNTSYQGWGATYPSWFILPPTQDFGSTSINKYWNCFKVL